MDGMRGRGRGSGVRAGALEQAPLAITVFALAANLRETGVAWRRLSVCRPQAGYRFVGGSQQMTAHAAIVSVSESS